MLFLYFNLAINIFLFFIVYLYIFWIEKTKNATMEMYYLWILVYLVLKNLLELY